MTTNKKLIERNLKFTDKYIYLSTKRGSLIDGDCSFCDNCGKLKIKHEPVQTMNCIRAIYFKA